MTNGNLRITWNSDAHQSSYPFSWLELHAYNPILISHGSKIKNESKLELELWDVKRIELELPSVDYQEVISTIEGVRKWCLLIWKYGFCLVENVPVSPEVTEKLIERISFIRPTHYGGFWDFTADLNVNDTAYTDIPIPLHTDGTYFTDPPGLQLFHLLKHTGTGGTTTLCDSFYCAKLLKQQDPQSYELLSRIPVPAHAAGEEDVLITPADIKPILNHDQNGNLIQCRWNISDRSTLDVKFDDPENDVPNFYKAIRKWNSIIESEENEFHHTLKPGQCLIFDNWRVFHSRRTKFTGERRMCGAYINRDDFVSRVKLLNLDRLDLLQTL